MTKDIDTFMPDNLPTFTKEDFMSTTPYEYLYSTKDVPFVMEIERRRLQSMAESAGFKGFLTAWKLYLQAKQTQTGIKFDNATLFSGQELELFSGEYICDDGGVTIYKGGRELVVCPHPIMPVERLVNIDNDEERLRIAYKKGRTWRDVIVPKSTIASSSAIIELSGRGVVVNSENAKELSTYLLDIEQRNYEEIPETRSVSRLGWVGEHGFSPYVEDLTFDGEQSFQHIFSAVTSCGDYEKWKDAMLDWRKSSVACRLALAAGFASAILEPCNLLPFFLHFWGGTENGKTVAIMVAASIWANPKMGEYCTTFNSTAVGQEMMASFLNSLPMCIDELQIQASQGVRDFDKIIYQLTEGIGKTRGTKTGGLQRQNTWKCCFLTSGEQPITTGTSFGGAINRIIEYECGEKIYHDLVGLCQIINHNYGFAGQEFVWNLQQEGVLQRVNEMQKEFYRALLQTDSTDKQAASVSAILTADSLATEWIFKDGRALTVDDLIGIMAKRDEVNANVRAYEYVLELIERNPTHFIPYNGDFSGELWGKHNPDHVAIFKSVFDRELANAGYNPTAFLAWAKRAGKIQTEGNRRTKKVRFGDSSTNCVCIVKESFVSDLVDEDDILP